MYIQGIKRGRTIELDSPLALPDGCEVRLQILPQTTLSLAERQRRLQNLFGAWSNQPDLDMAFARVERERHSDFGRTVPSFD
ncbi:MAG: hypothetical protein AAGG51_27590 [Cyanobacteria bacterium P01_G01_bin.54]